MLSCLFSFFDFLGECVEAVEAVSPKQSITADPVFGEEQPFGLEAEEMATTIEPAGYRRCTLRICRPKLTSPVCARQRTTLKFGTEWFLFDRFTAQAKAVLLSAETEAHQAGAAAVDSLHLAIACLGQEESDVGRLLSDHDVSPKMIAGVLRVGPVADPGRGNLPMSDVVKRELVAAMRLAMAGGRTMVTSAHLLGAILLVESDGQLVSALHLAGVDPDQWREDLGSGASGETIASGQHSVDPA